VELPSVTPRHQDFQLLICTGRPDLTSAFCVTQTLHQLSTFCSPGSRILIEMYRKPSVEGRLEHWSQTEVRYRRAARSAGFQLQEINGVAREGEFPTTIADIHAFTVSLVSVAASIKGSQDSRTILRVARMQRAFLKGACSRDVNRAVDKSLKLLLGGKRRRLFATLRTD
jgi:hypothetical protein